MNENCPINVIYPQPNYSQESLALKYTTSQPEYKNEPYV